MDEQQQNPYDFILNNPAQNQKKSALGGASFKKRLLFVGVGAIFLLIIFGVLFTILSSSGKGDAKQLYQIVAAQQDLIDLTNLGTTKVRDQQILNQSVTTNLVVISQNNDTKAYISKQGLSKSMSTKVATYRDTTYKKALDDADKSGKYDESYQAIYLNRVDLYRSKLQNAYASVSGANLKKKLQGYYAQINTIVGER